ncbi:uncharacterized protein PAC_16880 [Phialocephala subalpina]|uniref:Uncharacterized protein n=1 Tax=Phialocephala subalpina TaxID=576137 RepID=A0A1L7XPK2_9HELO|nr:uncharacterized protein PAC_16880 [Phialocephala subalpina]
MSSPIRTLNTLKGQESISKSFTILTPPQTDIFASPTHGYHFSAPILYTTLPLLSFTSSKATISVPFTFGLPNSPTAPNPTLKFDQGGIVFVLPEAGIEVEDMKKMKKEAHPRWIKAGIEVWEGKAWGSIVVREKWSDWSLFELSPPSPLGEYRLTLEMERMGDALMIYVLSEGKERRLVRKVPWVFLEEERRGVTEVLVGVYGARPDPFDEAKGKNLEIGVEGFEVWDGEGKKVV